MGSSAKGSATQPVYWTGSAWANTTYTLGKSVPSNAVFTDTHYTTHLYAGASDGVTNASTTNGNTYLILTDNTTARNRVKITGSGATTVVSDTSGIITISSTDTNTDTKNTAGSTNTFSKIFLIGATSQAANPQTYSHDTAYVGTDGCLYSGGAKVLTAHQSLSGYVPTSRTINSKALSANITLTASDVGAAAASHGNHVPATQTANNAKFLRNDNTWQTVTPANIGAAASSHTHKTITSIEIATSDWVSNENGGYKCTKSVSGILSTDDIIADVVTTTDIASNKLYIAAWSCICDGAIIANDGSVDIYCNNTKPSSNLTIKLQIIR